MTTVIFLFCQYHILYVIHRERCAGVEQYLETLSSSEWPKHCWTAVFDQQQLCDVGCSGCYVVQQVSPTYWQSQIKPVCVAFSCFSTFRFCIFMNLLDCYVMYLHERVEGLFSKPMFEHDHTHTGAHWVYFTVKQNEAFYFSWRTI